MPANKHVAIILVTSLFFLWGFALNLNPILIPHLKKACRLSDVQSAFVDSASYIAYFLLALPAGKFMKRYGYKSGIIRVIIICIGLFLVFPGSCYKILRLFFISNFYHRMWLGFFRNGCMGRISDAGSIQTAYLLAAACFIVVFVFAIKNISVEKLKLSIAH